MLDDDGDDDAPELDADPAAQRRAAVARALRRYAARLERKRDAMRDDLAEAARAAEWRRCGETLLAYARQVPARAASATLPDPANPAGTLEIALDPHLTAPGNAARYFKRAAKGERGQRDIPPRIATLESEIATLRANLDALARAGEDEEARDLAALELERALFALGSTAREQIKAPEPLARRELALPAVRANARSAPARPVTPPRAAGEPAGKLHPWRYRTREGWEVLIGRSSEGNDHLTCHLARPEDYWLHAHGCPGSHVVLRRGKGPNEPSKATLEEVASWAAWHSKARTAGKVPVHWTLKKYVRKPRGAKAGLVYIEREKALLVRPAEPPREQMSDAPPPGAPEGTASE